MYDAQADLVWFIPEVAPEVAGASAFYLYFGRGEKGRLTPLRLKAYSVHDFREQVIGSTAGAGVAAG